MAGAGGNKEKFKIGPNAVLRMSRQLQHILQLEENQFDNSSGEKAILIKTPITDDLDNVNLLQRNIFVTCNDVQGVFVNNKMTGVLTDFPVRSSIDRGNLIVEKHEKKYFKWIGNSLQTIKVVFTDEFLHPLQMNYGKSFALLHFRQCKPIDQ